MYMNQTMLLSYLYKYQARTNLKEEVWTLGLKGCHLSLMLEQCSNRSLLRSRWARKQGEGREKEGSCLRRQSFPW